MHFLTKAGVKQLGECLIDGCRDKQKWGPPAQSDPLCSERTRRPRPRQTRAPSTKGTNCANLELRSEDVNTPDGTRTISKQVPAWSLAPTYPHPHAGLPVGGRRPKAPMNWILACTVMCGRCSGATTYMPSGSIRSIIWREGAKPLQNQSR